MSIAKSPVYGEVTDGGRPGRWERGVPCEDAVMPVMVASPENQSVDMEISHSMESLHGFEEEEIVAGGDAGQTDEMDFKESLKSYLLPHFDNFEDDPDADLIPSPMQDDVKQIWDEVEEAALAATLETGAIQKKLKKGVKRKRFDFGDVIEAVKTTAVYQGFSNDRLEEIWKLVSHPELNLNCSQRKTLLFSMVPSEPVEASVIHGIVRWLEEEAPKSLSPTAKDGFKKSIVLSVYQLLSIYSKYGLATPEALGNEMVINRIVATPTSNDLIPWKMQLFRNVHTPETLNTFQVLNMEELLEKRGLKKTQAGDVQRALMLADVTRRTNPEGLSQLRKLRDLKYPKDVLGPFETCKRRMGLSFSGQSPLSHVLFKELLAPEQEGEIGGQQSAGTKRSPPTPEDNLHKLLETKEGVVEIALKQDPEILEVFQSWLRRLMDYRLNQFCGLCSEEDLPKYHYIFDVFYGISFLRQEGLPKVNQWLVNFLIHWDFDVFWGAIYRLIPYLLPSDILPDRKTLEDTLVNQFNNSNESILWNALALLFRNWTVKFSRDEPDEVRDAGLQEALIWLQNILEKFVLGFVAISRNFNEEKNLSLANHMMLFYVWVHGMCKRDERFKQIAKLPRCLPALAISINSPRMMEFLKTLRVDSGEENSDWDLLDVELCKRLEPQLCDLLPHCETTDPASSTQWCWFGDASPPLKMLNELTVACNSDK